MEHIDASENCEHESHQPEPTTQDKAYFPGQPKSLSGIALRALCLGITLAVGVIGTCAALVFTTSPLWRLPFLLATLSAFHFLEFWTQARYNPHVTTTTLFLFTSNGPAYYIAHAAAAVECLLANTVSSTVGLRSYSWLPDPISTLLVPIGLVMVVGGQALRSVAMAQAGQSFNHVVQSTRKSDHVLVTAGLYSRFRHPSYVGFYWWAVGTQLVMGNTVCLVAYLLVLYRFYAERIPREERFLVDFFGAEYMDYRRTVGTGIPFVR